MTLVLAQVQRRFLKSGLLVVTPSKSPDSCWVNQQTEALEHRIKMIDFCCIVLFPLMFAAFNVIYWSLQYANVYTTTSKLMASPS